jgi:hypothetical protein
MPRRKRSPDDHREPSQDCRNCVEAEVPPTSVRAGGRWLLTYSVLSRASSAASRRSRSSIKAASCTFISRSSRTDSCHVAGSSTASSFDLTSSFRSFDSCVFAEPLVGSPVRGGGHAAWLSGGRNAGLEIATEEFWSRSVVGVQRSAPGVAVGFRGAKQGSRAGSGDDSARSAA